MPARLLFAGRNHLTRDTHRRHLQARMNVMKICASPLIWLLAMLLPAVSLAQPANPSDVKIDRDLVFANAGGKDLKLHLYRPANSSGNVPVIVLIYNKK